MFMKRKKIYIFITIFCIAALLIFIFFKVKKYLWIQEGLESQAKSEEWYGKTWREVYFKYPWLNESTLINEKYFVYFDRVKERFIGETYGKSNIQEKRIEAISTLQELGVPVDKYPFDWTISDQSRRH